MHYLNTLLFFKTKSLAALELCGFSEILCTKLVQKLKINTQGGHELKRKSSADYSLKFLFLDKPFKEPVNAISANFKPLVLSIVKTAIVRRQCDDRRNQVPLAAHITDKIIVLLFSIKTPFSIPECFYYGLQGRLSAFYQFIV